MFMFVIHVVGHTISPSLTFLYMTFTFALSKETLLLGRVTLALNNFYGSITPMTDSCC